MVHGYADYGLSAAVSTLSHVVDFGEMSARVRNQASVDRFGNVVMWEDWSRGIGMKIVPPGAGVETVTLWVNSLIGPGYFVKVMANGGASAITGIYGNYPIPVHSRVGVEVELQTDGLWADVQVFVAFVIDGINTVCTFQYVPVGNLLQVWDQPAGWVTVAAGVNLTGFVTGWHRVKLVMDPVTKLYVRLFVDGMPYNVAAYRASTAALIGDGLINTYIYFDGPAGAINGIGYIGDVTVTVNEP